MKQTCYVVKNVLIFQTADSCVSLLRWTLIYSRFILFIVGFIVSCSGYVCVEKPPLESSLLTNCSVQQLTPLFILQFVCVQHTQSVSICLSGSIPLRLLNDVTV